MGVLLKLLLLGLLLGSGTLLWLQNQQPISLTLFGVYRTPGLALGMWIVLFTLAGIITSFCLRLLLYSPKRSQDKVKSKIPPRTTIKRPVNDQPESTWGEENKQPTSEPWEQLEVNKPEEVVTPPPSQEDKTTTTYSYSYVKATPKQKQNTTDQVYDAPYRILNPPYSPPESKEEEEDEDWV